MIYNLYDNFPDTGGNRVENLLKTEGFPAHHLFLRNWLTERDLEEFKIEAISIILKAHPERKFIFIFDNSDASLALAEKIPKKFSDKVLTIYLHHIIEKKIPGTAKSYYTAFDIALEEYRAGRIQVADLNRVGLEVLKEGNSKMLFPDYATCPFINGHCQNLSSENQNLCNKVYDHIASLCKKRGR